MKVIYLNTYGNGSTGKIVDLLKKGCSDNNIDSHSIYSREYCATLETSTRFYSTFGFYNDVIHTRILDNHGLNSKNNTKRIIKELDEFRPDIIHIHNLHGYWINYQLLFKYIKEKGIKVVFTLHDCWSFTGHCTHFDYIGCEKWKNMCYECPQKQMYPKATLCDGSKRNFLKKKEAFCSLDDKQMIIVTPSEWLKSKVKESFLNKYECVVINNSINVDVFKKTESDFREKHNIGSKKLLLAVANYWDERKGLNYFLEMAKLKPEWEFVYIGKEKEKVANVSKNVIHIERTDSQEELAKWYSTADVYVNPTLEDNYPTTNLEAIACGTPVVTFNTGGSPEIVENTGFGAIVENRTTGEMLQAIEQLFVKSTDYDKTNIGDFYNPIEFCHKYYQLYMKLYNHKDNNS